MKNRVTLLALAALAMTVVIAYFSQRWLTAAPAMLAAEGSAAAVPKSDSQSSAKNAPAGKGVAASIAVEVVTVRSETVRLELAAVGSLRSNESVILRPEVAGRVAQIGFRDGQEVKRGQLLVALDATLNDAEVAKARAEWNLAQSNLKRTDDLAQRNFVSGSAHEQALSSVQVLEADLRLVEARQSKMRIVAPFDGVVGIRTVSVGDYVKDGADLVNVEDISTLKVDFRLPERNFAQIKTGQSVEVTADALPGEKFRGVLDAINPRIDVAGRSLELRALLPNARGVLRPGMFVRVRMIVGQRNDALLVPEEAIVPSGEEFFVFKVVENATRRTRVKLGVRRDAKVEILDGLAAGDSVVTAGMRLFGDGQTVRVVQPGQSPAQPTSPVSAANSADASRGRAAPNARTDAGGPRLPAAKAKPSSTAGRGVSDDARDESKDAGKSGDKKA